MRIVGRIAVLLLAALVIGAGPVTAATLGEVTATCTHDGGNRAIRGTFTVAPTASGETITLTLFGDEADGSRVELLSFGPIALDDRSRSYPFEFAAVDVGEYVNYLITAEPGGTIISSLDAAAECVSPGVPEAPSPVLLWLSGMVVAVVVIALRSRPVVVRAGR